MKVEKRDSHIEAESKQGASSRSKVKNAHEEEKQGKKRNRAKLAISSKAISEKDIQVASKSQSISHHSKSVKVDNYKRHAVPDCYAEPLDPSDQRAMEYLKSVQ